MVKRCNENKSKEEMKYIDPRDLVISILWSYQAYFLASALKMLWKSFLYFPKKIPPNILETEFSYIFFKKVFLIFWERYIQNPGIFRTQGIFKK